MKTTFWTTFNTLAILAIAGYLTYERLCSCETAPCGVIHTPGQVSATSQTRGATGPRPANWATPVELAGAPNLHRVNDTLYRSAQPTAGGMQGFKELGIRTVINLRSFNSDRDEIGETGLGYEHLYMKAWHPEEEEVVRFLQIVSDPARTPVLVHCQHGADRTGTLCAIYRIAIEGWSKEDAIQEMTKGDFGFHEVWKNLPEWIRELDIDNLKEQAGLAP